MNIKRSVCQSCPLSMLLSTLCLKPFLRLLDDKLAATTTESRNKRAAVIAYADYFTTSPAEFPIEKEALRCYAAASVAKLKMQKFKAITLGLSNSSHDVLGIPYHAEMKVLRVLTVTNIHQSPTTSWTTVTGKVPAQARKVYCRDLSLHQRIQYVNSFLLTKTWYNAHIPPVLCTGK